MQPTIGRIVIYKSKINNGPGNDVLSPAMVIRTKSTTVSEVIDRWGPEPSTVVSSSDPTVTHETTARPWNLIADLPDDETVDLIVFGLGQNYREYGVTHGRRKGEWRWPADVSLDLSGEAAATIARERAASASRVRLSATGFDEIGDAVEASLNIAKEQNDART